MRGGLKQELKLGQNTIDMSCILVSWLSIVFVFHLCLCIAGSLQLEIKLQSERVYICF